jgi:hypothetical protein
MWLYDELQKLYEDDTNKVRRDEFWNIDISFCICAC